MSGGNYPSSYHLQSHAQGYMNPRHRLPLSPPNRPSYSGQAISQAHMGQSHLWGNKHGYPSGYHEPPAPYYPPSVPRGYAHGGRSHHYPSEDISRWTTDPNNFMNPSVVIGGNPYQQKLENPDGRFVKNMQHESMDLSSHYYGSGCGNAAQMKIPPAHSSSIPSNRSDINGEVSRRTAALKGPPKNASSSYHEKSKTKPTTTTANIMDQLMKKDNISVIAENPLHERSGGVIDQDVSAALSKKTGLEISGFGLRVKSSKDMLPDDTTCKLVPPRSTTDSCKIVPKSIDTLICKSINDSMTTTTPKNDVISKQNRWDNPSLPKSSAELKEDTLNEQNVKHSVATVKFDVVGCKPPVVARVSNQSEVSESAAPIGKNPCDLVETSVIKSIKSPSELDSTVVIKSPGKKSCDLDFTVIKSPSGGGKPSEPDSGKFAGELLDSTVIKSPGKKTCESDPSSTLSPEEFTVIKSGKKSASESSDSTTVIKSVGELESDSTVTDESSGIKSLSSELDSTTIKEPPEMVGVIKSPPANKLESEVKSNDSVPDRVESILETMFQTPSSVIVSAQSQKATSSNLKMDSVENMLTSPPSTEVVESEKDTKTDFVESSNSTSVIMPLKNVKDDINKESDELPDSSTSENEITSDYVSKNVEESSDAVLKVDTGDKLFEKTKTSLPKIVIPVQMDMVDDDESDYEDSGVLVVDESRMEDVKDGSTTDVSSIKIEQPTFGNGIDNQKDVGGVQMESSRSNTISEKDTFVKVETKLEKLFAGILDTNSENAEESSTIKQESTSSLSMNGTSTPAPVHKKKGRKKGSKNSGVSKKKDGGGKDKAKSSLQKEVIPDQNTMVGSKYRVPIIRIEGSKENPRNVTIINNANRHEDEDALEGGSKRKFKSGFKTDRNKKLAVSYNICKNYDPESSDDSWVCIFCKLGPHCPGIAGDASGDLFGPYFIPAPMIDEQDGEDGKRKRRNSRQSDSFRKKKRLSSSIDNIVIDENNSDEPKEMEIWGHENCFVWSSGIHLLGSTLNGIEESVTTALSTKCVHCGEYGASIGCQARHCKSCIHYSCALHVGWELNNSTFTTRCHIHRVPD